jgi:hypothetical protein
MRTTIRNLAVVSAVTLTPFAFPHGALAWDALTCQEAYQACSLGDALGCDVAQQCQALMTGPGGGSPADRWVGPDELQHGGIRGVRRGPLTTYDFVN